MIGQRETPSRSKALRAVCLGVFVAGPFLSAQPARAPIVAIMDTTVLPMTSNDTVLRRHTVLVSGHDITQVGPTERIDVPAGAIRIDGRGKYLLPGLADMHVHLEYFERPDILALFITNGVTAIRNMDGRPFILDWKRRVAAGQLPGPRIYTAGPLLDGAPPVRPDNTVVRTAVEARAAVEEQAGLGYDFIKIYSALSTEAFGGIIEAARARQLPVAGHVPRAVGLDAALANHLSSIEHLADYASAIEADDSPFKGKGHWSKRYLSAPVDSSRLSDVAKRQAAARVANVPTLIQPKRELLREAEIDAMLARPEVAYLPLDARQQWAALSKRVSARLDDEDWALAAAGETHRRRVVSALQAAGVRLLIGTDTPNPFVVPGYSVHDELALAVEAGLRPAEALAASTREAARFMRDPGWGTIERGKFADLLLLDADPFADIANTRRIRGVMVRGEWLDRDTRARLLAALK